MTAAREPDLPTFDLVHGAWTARVFDPRPDPHALGARYVHGGYVSELRHRDRVLSARPQATWDPYVGEGLPEVFEGPLGFHACAEGEPFLRIGAGRLARHGDGWPQARGPLVGTVDWLFEVGTNHLRASCSDRLVIAGKPYGYALVRELHLNDQGLTSRTELRLEVPWSHPVIWFAHPFFAQADGTGISQEFPATAPLPKGFSRDDEGRLHAGSTGGFSAVTGVWGTTDPVRLHLDPRQGGGRLDLHLDRPLDKLVIYATQRAYSVEPYLARAWQDGETAAWTLDYRFTPA